jgi:hypothetical protein
MMNIGIKNNGTLTLGMLNVGAAFGTLNTGTKDDNDATGFGRGMRGDVAF